MDSSKLPPKGEDGVTRQRTVAPEVYSEDTLLKFSSPAEYAEFLVSKGAATRPRFRRSLHLGNIRPGARILDLGCGRGEVLLHATLAGAEVWGVDYSVGSLSLAKRTLGIADRLIDERAVLVCADAKALPFPDGSFDRVFMLDLAEHLHDWELIAALREVIRVLSPDGYLLIHTLPNRWALEIGYRLARLVFRRLPASPRREVESVVHVNEQDILHLHSLLREAGFHSRVWLESFTAEQAVWQSGRGGFSDVRQAAYSLLATPLPHRLYAFLCHLPLRLILANDIYSIAWRPGGRPPIPMSHLPWAITERVFVGLATGLRALGRFRRDSPGAKDKPSQP